MTSLSEVYRGDERAGPSLRRLYLGISLFVVGVVLVVGAIIAATTEVVMSMGHSITHARLVAGVLGGVGAPAAFLGIFTVLPANRRTRAAAVIGAGISMLGVGLFWHAYPCQWIGATCGTPDLTFATVGVYFLGTITTFWCMFVGVANFKTRNDPGGTVKMEVTRQGETKIIEVDSRRGLGGIGLLGATPDGEVETQTNNPSVTTASDGGATTNDIRSPLDSKPQPTGDAEVLTNQPDSPPAGDTYCGNCAEFDYVRTENGIQPYCGYHDELMDDMDACSSWRPRN
ncbi:MAG: DUF7139 domain-containing protein [Halobacteriota archaeon]